MANRIHVQGVFLGPKGDFDTFNETAGYVYAGQLGAVARVGDKKYQLVKITASATAANIAANFPLYWADRSAYLAGGYGCSEAGVNAMCGVNTSSHTAGRYVWMQIAGECTMRNIVAATYAAGIRAVAASGGVAAVTAGSVNKEVGHWIATVNKSTTGSFLLELDTD